MATRADGGRDGSHGARRDPQAQRWRHAAPRVHPLVWTHRSGRKSLVPRSTAAEVEPSAEDGGRLMHRATLLGEEPVA